MAKKFNLFFMATCAILTLFIWFPLRQAGECCSYDDIIQRQLASDSLYHSKYNPTASAYKLSGIKFTKPDILVVGSSRTMQFRREFFSRSFYNAGGVASGVEQLEDFINRLLVIHKPRVILIGVDMWWFNQNHPYAAPDYVHTANAPSKNLLQKEMEINKYLAYAPAHGRMGYSAMQHDLGFAPDGSYYGPLSTLTLASLQFHDTYERIERGGLTFEHSANFSNEKVTLFLKTINQLEKKWNKGCFVLSAFCSVYRRRHKFKREL